MRKAESTVWDNAKSEDIIAQYIALKRETELLAEYEEYEQMAAQEPIDTTSLDERVMGTIGQAQKQQAKAKRKQTWRKAMSVAAILLLILLACPTIAFAVSPQFRESVYQFITDWQDGHVLVTAERINQDETVIGAHKYYPGWIPDGFELIDESSDPTVSTYNYYDGERSIIIIIQPVDTVMNLDNERMHISKDYEVHGQDTILAQDDRSNIILWNDGNMSLFIKTNISLQDTKKIAENILIKN